MTSVLQFWAKLVGTFIHLEGKRIEKIERKEKKKNGLCNLWDSTAADNWQEEEIIVDTYLIFSLIVFCFYDRLKWPKLTKKVKVSLKAASYP